MVNFGITFGLISDPEYNKFDVLRTATRRVFALFREPRYFGEPLYITDVYSALNKLDGVVDVYDVKITRKVGGSYSDTTYNFDENMSSDGRYLSVPDNVCLEMKFPESDIKGAVR